jgi:hypothetical protein
LLIFKCLHIPNYARRRTVSYALRFILCLEWIMRNVLPTEDRLKNIPYPDPSVNTIDNPVEVIFKIPEKIYVGEDATSFKIGVWDSEKQEWSTEYIGQIAKEHESKKDPRQVHFTTTKFAPIAFLQSRCMDYPY